MSGFVTPAQAYVTSQQVYECGQDPLIELVAQAEQYKRQGLSKDQLLKSLDPSKMDPEFVKQVKKVLDFVFDKQHEISAEISAVVLCLNTKAKEEEVKI